MQGTEAQQEVLEQAVFYGPDGQVLDAEEQSFLEAQAYSHVDNEWVPMVKFVIMDVSLKTECFIS